uniref:Transposase n=1 Tax=Panagrellus redivivus TaxID=6233 RepID=A0A7E4VAQ9_PANRE
MPFPTTTRTVGYRIHVANRTMRSDIRHIRRSPYKGYLIFVDGNTEPSRGQLIALDIVFRLTRLSAIAIVVESMHLNGKSLSVDQTDNASPCCKTQKATLWS